MRSFQAVHRIEGREIQGRIASCQDTSDEEERTTDEPEPTIGQGQLNTLSYKDIERRQRQHDKQQRHTKCEEDYNERLTEELVDQLHPQRSNCLPYPDFFGSLFRTCCAEVHEIDAGQQQDKHSNGPDES